MKKCESQKDYDKWGVPAIVNRSAASLAGNNRYFYNSPQIESGYSGGRDILMGPKTIKRMLEDTTTNEYDVIRVKDDPLSRGLVTKWGTDTDNIAYVIGEVKSKSGGMHFVNITDLRTTLNEKTGEYGIEVQIFDTYERRNKPDVRWIDLKDIYGVYVIEEMQQKLAREEKERQKHERCESCHGLTR